MYNMAKEANDRALPFFLLVAKSEQADPHVAQLIYENGLFLNLGLNKIECIVKHVASYVDTGIQSVFDLLQQHAGCMFCE